VFTEGFLLKGVAAPGIAALVATFVAGRADAGRASAAIGFAIAQLLGLWLTHEPETPWIPGRNLNWAPWACLGAGILGPTFAAAGLRRADRWSLALFVALAAAAVFVPGWPDLVPARPTSIALVTLGLMVLTVATGGLSHRVPSRLLALTLAVTALLVSALIAASLSLRLGEASLVTTAALSGALLGESLRPDSASLKALALPFAVGIGGWCYMAAIEQPPPAAPLYGLLAVAFAPLILWTIAIGPLSRSSPGKRWTIGLLLFAIWLAATGAWTWFSTETTGDEYAGCSAESRHHVV
jgi:hypothetical protein